MWSLTYFKAYHNLSKASQHLEWNRLTNLVILNWNICFFSQPDLVKEFESNAELCKKDQSIPSDTRNTKTTATAEPTSIPSDTCLHATILNSTEDNQQNFETKTFENSMGNRKHVTINSSGKDVLRSVTQSSGTSDPSKLQNAEELQTSLKDVLRTANATTTTINITSGKMLEKPAENEEDDELESLLSLGTPGMNRNSDSTAVLQNKRVSWMEENNKGNWTHCLCCK